MVQPEAAQTPTTLADRAKALALALGFDRAGIARLDAPLPHAETLREWLARGRHGEMAWLARDPDTRIDPRRRFPWAKTAIVVSLVYDTSRSDQGRRPASGAAGGRGARSPQAREASAQRAEGERSSSGAEASEVHRDVSVCQRAHRSDGLEGHRSDPAAILRGPTARVARY